MKTRALFLLLFTSIFLVFLLMGNADEQKLGGIASITVTPTPPVIPQTPIPFNLQSNYNENQNPELSLALSAPIRGNPNDEWADVIIGQPSFNQITPNEVVGNKLFNPGGVYVDRSIQPNRVYVYDAGNSRVLGFRYLGTAQGGSEAGQPCTSNSDHPDSTCEIDPTRGADIVLGQNSFNSSTCNGDSALQNYPVFPSPSNTTLCGLNPINVSILEGGSMAAMAADSQGNFYFPDFFNNRVLRYDDPFSTDSVADYIWGQSDFASASCNMGASYDQPNNKSLCLAPPPGHGNTKTGVATDSQGNLWVADTQNNRVLRFPFDPGLGAPAQTADLVLGQQDFNTAIFGGGLNQMASPTSVRVDSSGNVYVADGEHYWTRTVGRILIFHPPLSNGMSASQVIQNGIGEPTAVELDPTGGFWVNDSDNQRILRFDNNGNLQRTVSGVPSRIWGGVGIDRDSNLMITGWDPQQVLVYTSPSYNWTSTFLRADAYGSFNQEGARGLLDPGGLEVAAGQMIVADGSRLLFWDNPEALVNNYPPADGVIGQPDFHTRPRWDPTFGRMRADNYGRLWITKTNNITAQIYAYQLPLTTQALPILTISSPLPLQGGGIFTWSPSLNIGGIAYQSGCDCLWLSDRDNNRTFRIRNVSTNPTVDIVLGQTNIAGTHCNQGRDSDEDYVHPTHPSQDSLCAPGGLAFDTQGNLYVADHALEVAGNWRLLEFDANTLPNEPASVVYGIPASRVFGRNGSFTEAYCVSGDAMCAPWEPAFGQNNQMILGFNGYLGTRFAMIYQDPLTNPVPVKALADLFSHVFSIRSQCGNLFLLDLTRDRVLIYMGSPLSRSDFPSVLCTLLADTNPSSAAQVNFTVTFSESVTGVDIDDFDLVTTGISDATITEVIGWGSSYTVTVSTGMGSGTASLHVPVSATIEDLAGNPLADLPFTSGQTYIIRKSVPKTPLLRSPRTNTITKDAMPAFWWTNIIGAQTYIIEFATNSTFSNNVERHTANVSPYTAIVPIGDGKYYWRVRAYNASSQPSSWSSTRAITIDTTSPSVPVLSSPANNILLRRTPTFKWFSAPTAISYEFQYDDDLGFASPNYTATVRGIFRKPPAMPFGTYYWRVRAKDAVGNWSAWSAPFKFTVGP